MWRCTRDSVDVTVDGFDAMIADNYVTIDNDDATKATQ